MLTGLQEPVITPESDHSVIIIIVIITFSRLLSLFLVLTTLVSCQLSLILLQLLLTITPLYGQEALVLVLIFPYYVSFIVHIGMRGALC